MARFLKASEKAKAKNRIIYLKLYAEGQAVLDRMNPCEVRKVDGQVTCRNGRENRPSNPIFDWPGPSVNFCCHGCKHLGPEGCKAKALTCKVWLCGFIREKRPDVEMEMEKVRAKVREEFKDTHATCCDRADIEESVLVNYVIKSHVVEVGEER